VFHIMLAVTFQSVFSLEMYQNNIFLKKLFLTLTRQNDPKP